MIPVSGGFKLNVEWQGALGEPGVIIASRQQDLTRVKVKALKFNGAPLGVKRVGVKVHLAVDKVVEAEVGVDPAHTVFICMNACLKAG